MPVDNADLTSWKYIRQYGYPVVAEILRDDSPIPPQEIAATVISESPLSIAIVMDVFKAADLRNAALDLLQRTRAEGYRDMQFDDKLTALGQK